MHSSACDATSFHRHISSSRLPHSTGRVGFGSVQWQDLLADLFCSWLPSFISSHPLWRVLVRFGCVLSEQQATMTQSTLLKNGVVILHGADNSARGVKADLLIEGDKIARIEPKISVSSGVKVLDCTDKIIAPGFVDTHRHMYNIALRGRHGDNLLPDYLVQGESRWTFQGRAERCKEDQKVDIGEKTTWLTESSSLKVFSRAARSTDPKSFGANWLVA